MRKLYFVSDIRLLFFRPMETRLFQIETWRDASDLLKVFRKQYFQGSEVHNGC
jgi:hypothetical protein